MFVAVGILIRMLWIFPFIGTLLPVSALPNNKPRASVYPVLGVRGLGVDTTQPRLEIRELERNKDQFNVYLLGLRQLQNISQDDSLSHYQVAGIHGRPFVPWDGVEGDPQAEYGYCAHSSNLFPTWHRPYLALIESLIYSNARQAISEFPTGEAKDRMNVALDTLRMPYWDAAAIPPLGTSSLPNIVQSKTVDVDVPNGASTTKITIPNPLYAYTFHPLPVADFETPGSKAWTLWGSTKRYPTTRDNSAESRNTEIGQSLDANRQNLMQATYQILGMQKRYVDISNNLAGSADKSAIPNNLESVHDTLHNTVGHGGHMYDTAFSAFDPIFWLLHTNTDRLLAIWQELHPESYVESQINPGQTFTTPAYSTADEDTPLHPFHRDSSGSFWTSALVRDHTVFGSTYPEFLGLTATDTLIGRVNTLYGPNATSRFSWENDGTFYKFASPQHGEVQYQYFANVRAGAGGVRKVFVFLGEDGTVETESVRWVNRPGFVGYTGFQNSEVKENMTATDVEMQMNSVVALTSTLEEKMEMGELLSFDEVAVGAYLQDKLTWRLVGANDEPIAPEDAHDFTIEVSWAKIIPATVDTFPEVQGKGFKQLIHATSGKIGGA